MSIVRFDVRQNASLKTIFLRNFRVRITLSNQSRLRIQKARKSVYTPQNEIEMTIKEFLGISLFGVFTKLYWNSQKDIFNARIISKGFRSHGLRTWTPVAIIRSYYPLYSHFIMHVPKRRTLAITIYRYRNLDLAVTIAEIVQNVLENAKNENIREKKLYFREGFMMY